MKYFITAGPQLRIPRELGFSCYSLIVPQLDRPIALVAGPSPLVRAIRILALVAITTTVFVFAVAIAAVVAAH